MCRAPAPPYIGKMLQGQVAIMAYIDVFVVLAGIAALIVPLSLSLRTVRRGGREWLLLVVKVMAAMRRNRDAIIKAPC
jgi:hypothetical protein